MRFLYFLCLLSLPTAVVTDSHSLWFLVTYIEGETPFPAFSVVYMLDDITVGYYNSEAKICVPRGNTTNEDEEVDLISYYLNEYYPPIVKRFIGLFKNKTKGPVVHQLLTVCELPDKDDVGQMITKIAFEGSTTDEMHFIDDTLTFQGMEKVTKLHLEMFRWFHAMAYKRGKLILEKYLKKRATQGKRRVKPRVRLIQKASDSGGVRVSCLATGFYPRHINLTLLRDGQPVSDHELTGGDLLPNGDGTYQMRKSQEIRAEERQKHKYTCSAKHLSLDNKLIVTLDFDHSEPYKSVIPSVLAVLALMLVFGAAAAVWKRRHTEDEGMSQPFDVK
ncbi:major histocompatibility complex class I-related gene protein-like [Danio aesculapii]|uniref:major histocompatibility complex class I-related gene protein-like n=1 Tax=Danio aesculapii TaxID=1142201 RepID=UPI0024BFDB72|nr:major histocompatibility complex class I-related gene protein-like [Danio aesculapii]